jgi:hypothetical protein
MTRAKFVFGLSLGLLIPTMLAAALPPSALLRARLEASHHVQIAITRVTPPSGPQFGNCIIEGTIVRVFKGDLRLNSAITVRKSCIGPAIGVAGRGDVPPPGGAIYVQTAQLQRARYIEAFLAGTPADVSFDQAVIITAPSDRPRCTASMPDSICNPDARPAGSRP